jgi:hypothetical protein
MRWASVLALALVALAAATPARADGDPASDFLITEYAFVPIDGGIRSADAKQLTELLLDATARKFRVKVALIPKQDDLGAVTLLWKQPQRYAQFLGQELYYVYKGKLLIVMPNGYGIYDHGRPTAADRKLLASLSPPASNAEQAAAAITAVRRLAQQSGVTLASAAKKSGGSTTRDRVAIILIAVGAAGLFVLFLIPRRRRSRKEFG